MRRLFFYSVVQWTTVVERRTDFSRKSLIRVTANGTMVSYDTLCDLSERKEVQIVENKKNVEAI